MHDTQNRRRVGALCLVIGNVAALALVFHSPLWLWELNESWPVRPVAEITASADGSPIRLKGFNERPSLNWYAEQRIRREQSDDGKNLRLSDQPQPGCRLLAKAGDWTLSDCDKMTKKGE